MSLLISLPLTLLLCLSGPLEAQSAAPELTLAQKKRKKRPGMLKLYKKATILYDQQKYDDAISIYSRILKTYPGHEPSRTYIAKSLYRLGRSNQAYKVFAQLKLDNLDPETSYEYGQTFFRKKKFETAYKAFKRIPNGHPLFDLSSYYGGVCAIRMKKYSEALDLFDQAVVLPSKLMASKKTLQKQTEEIVLNQQRKALEDQKKKPKNTVLPPKSTKNGASPPEKERTKSTPEQGFLTAKRSAAHTVSLFQQKHATMMLWPLG